MTFLEFSFLSLNKPLDLLHWQAQEVVEEKLVFCYFEIIFFVFLSIPSEKKCHA